MSEPSAYPPLRLAAEAGEEVFPEPEFEAKITLDPNSAAPIPIRPEVEIELDPDFPDF